MEKQQAQRQARKRKKRIRWDRLALLTAPVLVTVLALVLIIRAIGTASKIGSVQWDGSWYEDGLDRIRDDKPLIEGMKAFEKRIGIRPYLSLINDVAPETLDSFAQNRYNALFGGDGHLLVVYDEWEEGVYYLSAQTGAGDDLTGEDLSRLMAAIERAYADPANESYAAAFGAGFRQGAEELSVKSGGGAWLLVVLGLALFAGGGILILRARKKAAGRARRARQNG